MTLRRRWIVSSAWGWLTGFALTVALALVFDAVGGSAQFMVGVGMGAGVGLGQGRVVRTWNVRTGRWLLATVLGMGGAFLVGDVLAGFGVPYSLPPYVALGALTAGLLQSHELRLSSGARLRWVGASLGGWGVAGLLVLGSDAVGGVPGFVLLGAALLGGGAGLGAVTGFVLPTEADQYEQRTGGDGGTGAVGEGG